MCGGKGGGNAAADAQAAEDKRRAEIAQSTAAIDAALNSPGRQAQIGQIGTDVKALNQDKLSKDREDEARQLKFALARAGTAGGSADTFTSGQLQEKFNEGVLRTSQLGDQAEQQARADDAATRANLVAQVQGGLSQGAAVNNALESGRASIDRAQSNNSVASIGDLFQGLSDQLGTSRTVAGVKTAQQKFKDDRFKTLSPGAGFSGSSVSIG